MRGNHTGMIEAKNNNSELVYLVNTGESWRKSNNDYPVHDNLDYFLCHPRHVKEIIHLLNGGNVECYHKSREHLIFNCAEIESWKESHWYMNGDVVSSIKPE